MVETALSKELVGIGTQTFGSASPAEDVIKGWNDRLYNTDPTQISGMVPFVQLIGLYSETEIGKLTMTDRDWRSDARHVVFAGEDGGAETDLNTLGIQKRDDNSSISDEQSD